MDALGARGLRGLLESKRRRPCCTADDLEPERRLRPELNREPRRDRERRLDGDRRRARSSKRRSSRRAPWASSTKFD